MWISVIIGLVADTNKYIIKELTSETPHGSSTNIVEF